MPKTNDRSACVPIAQVDGARARVEVDDRCTRVILNLSYCQSTMKIRPLPNRREHGTGMWDRDFFCLVYAASCCHRMPRKTILSSRGYRATIEKSLSITHSRDRRPSRDPALQRLRFANCIDCAKLAERDTARSNFYHPPYIPLPRRHP